MLAYTICTTTCRVAVSALDGSGSRTVPGSQGASHPAIWGARVAWVRGAATVMTSLADGSRPPSARSPCTGAGRRAYEATFPGDPGSGVTCADGRPEDCAILLSDPFAFRPSGSLVRVP